MVLRLDARTSVRSRRWVGSAHELDHSCRSLTRHGELQRHAPVVVRPTRAAATPIVVVSGTASLMMTMISEALSQPGPGGPRGIEQHPHDRCLVEGGLCCVRRRRRRVGPPSRSRYSCTATCTLARGGCAVGDSVPASPPCTAGWHQGGRGRGRGTATVVAQRW